VNFSPLVGEKRVTTKLRDKNKRELLKSNLAYHFRRDRTLGESSTGVKLGGTLTEGGMWGDVKGEMSETGALS